MRQFQSVSSLAMVLVLSGLALPAPALAEGLELQTVTYACERGVSVPVAYVNGAEDAIVVLTVEGRQISLYAEPAASGVRYAWPSDGSGYVWWTKGEEASLYWKDGTDGSETLLLAECKSGS